MNTCVGILPYNLIYKINNIFFKELIPSFVKKTIYRPAGKPFINIIFSGYSMQTQQKRMAGPDCV